MAARKKSKKTAKKSAARAREPKRRAAKKAARPVKRPAKRQAKRAAKKVRERARARGAGTAAPSAKKAAKKIARRAREPKRAAKKTAKRTAKKSAKRPAKKAAKKSAKRPAKKSAAKRPAKKSAAKKTAKKAAKKSAVKKTAKKTSKKARERERARGEGAAAPPVEERERFPESERERRRRGYVRIDMLGRMRESVEEAEARRSKEYGPTVAKAARRIEELLEFVASLVRQRGYLVKVHVHANADSTVDGDLSIAIQPEQANARAFGSSASGFKTGLLSVLYDAFADHGVNKIVGMWFSVGFYLPSESQVFQAADRRPYKRYEGALRFGYAYQRITGKEDIFYKALESARLTINGVLDKHVRPMTGMYVRVSWSEDGSLRRRR